MRRRDPRAVVWRKRNQWAEDCILTNDTRPLLDDDWVDAKSVHTDGSAMGEYTPDIDVNGPDAAFIAAARQDVPALVAEVRRLRAVERQLRHALCTAYAMADEPGDHGTEIMAYLGPLVGGKMTAEGNP